MACSGSNGNFSSSVNSTSGISLYYGADDNLVHEVTWSPEDDLWTSGSTFERSDGNSGLACYQNSTSYLILMNFDKNIEIWWKDFNTSVDNGLNLPHPKGVWTRSSLYPLSSWVLSMTLPSQPQVIS